jgi:hypothetical protein
MPRTLGNLKKQVLAYMARANAVFTVDSEDCLLAAINHVKDFAQRAIVFRYAEVFIQVPNVSRTNGGSLANAQLYGTVTGVSVRSVRRPYLAITGGSGQFPIAMTSREQWATRQLRKYEASTTTKQSEVQPLSLTGTPLTCVLHGQTFYVYPADVEALGGETFTVYFDAVQWIPDFANDNDTHWLLDFAFDYMLFRTIVELNFFLKEDARVQISEATLRETWQNVVNWNETVQGLFVDDANLD